MGVHQLALLRILSFSIVLFCLRPFIITAQPEVAPSFKCMTDKAMCQALGGYLLTQNTTLSQIRSLFQVKSLGSLLKANFLPPSTPENYSLSPDQTVRIPFTCRCNNGTGHSDGLPVYTVSKAEAGNGLAYIADEVFQKLTTTKKIQDVNHISDSSNLRIAEGQKLWIPLPCSCDDVEGEKAVHYAHVVDFESSLDQVAVEFGVNLDTLQKLNSLPVSVEFNVGRVIDIPLKPPTAVLSQGHSLLSYKDTMKATNGSLKSTDLLPPSYGPVPGHTKGYIEHKNVKIGLHLLVPIIIFVVVRHYRKLKRQWKQKEATEQGDGSWISLPDSPVRFTHEVLKAATSTFDMQRKLGHGGFGSVFEDTLSDGTRIAVKRLDFIGQGRKEFVTEVRTIGSLHHINLVKLVGFCVQDGHRLLVYEYMKNGSLEKWIFHGKSRRIIEWNIRKKIVLQIARGLAYLHEECHKNIVRLDVKPHNVLLDDQFNARLSDFGLARLIDRNESFVMTQMRGTPGYLAPECLGGKISEKVDVYSYGVVVLEVIFGRKNLDYSPDEEGVNLLTTTVKSKAENDQLCDLLQICSDEMQQDGGEVERIMKLAIWCLHTNPATRPTMSTVVKFLEGSLSVDIISENSSSLSVNENQMAYSTTQSASILSGTR